MMYNAKMGVNQVDSTLDKVFNKGEVELDLNKVLKS